MTAQQFVELQELVHKHEETVKSLKMQKEMIMEISKREPVLGKLLEKEFLEMVKRTKKISNNIKELLQLARSSEGR